MYPSSTDTQHSHSTRVTADAAVSAGSLYSTVQYTQSDVVVTWCSPGKSVGGSRWAGGDDDEQEAELGAAAQYVVTHLWQVLLRERTRWKDVDAVGRLHSNKHTTTYTYLTQPQLPSLY